jgi:hypothetical protein
MDGFSQLPMNDDHLYQDPEYPLSSMGKIKRRTRKKSPLIPLAKKGSRDKDQGSRLKGKGKEAGFLVQQRMTVVMTGETPVLPA